MDDNELNQDVLTNLRFNPSNFEVSTLEVRIWACFNVCLYTLNYYYYCIFIQYFPVPYLTEYETFVNCTAKKSQLVSGELAPKVSLVEEFREDRSQKYVMLVIASFYTVFIYMACFKMGDNCWESAAIYTKNFGLR